MINFHEIIEKNIFPVKYSMEIFFLQILRDFKALYPDQEQNLITNWIEYAKSLISHLSGNATLKKSDSVQLILVKKKALPKLKGAGGSEEFEASQRMIQGI